MKKYRLITACLFILLAFLLFNIFNRNRNSTIETFNADAATKEELTDELVIALFIEDIANAVTNYYSGYYSGEIAVYDYEIEIVDTGKKEPAGRLPITRPIGGMFAGIPAYGRLRSPGSCRASGLSEYSPGYAPVPSILSPGRKYYFLCSYQ